MDSSVPICVQSSMKDLHEEWYQFKLKTLYITM